MPESLRTATGCRILLVAGVISFAFAVLASAQTKWFKYEGNPVLDVGPAGAWDDEFIHIDRLILIDSVYHMWYTGGWHKAQIGHATSRDGVTWTRDKRNPVLRARQGTWESNVSRPYVILSGTGYHMWYNGDDIATFRIGHATSKDGVTWKRHRGNPVLDVGGLGEWDEGFSGLPSIVGPDSLGGFRMWYQGKGMKIGYATSTSETSWTKYPDPVFWGNDVAWYPRVILNGNVYEMWCGLRDPLVPRSKTGYPQPGILGYATSHDGIHWIESPENPVLRCGPEGAWDDAGLAVGDILFDGQIYHMWYEGDDGTNRWRGGYAVSPQGLKVLISASNAFVKPGHGTVEIAIHANHHEGLSFWARICAPAGNVENPLAPLQVTGMRQEALLELHEEGNHGDSPAADGLLATSWTPTKEMLYFVDLKLRLKRRGIRDFEMYKAAAFTAIGPVDCEYVKFIGDQIPHPGDTIFVVLTLRNKGLTASARSVSASLSTEDPSIASITEFSPAYGDILPGKTANTLGHYLLFIHPFSPFERDVKVNVSISSWGIPFWHDSFTIHVVPPWWRSIWAYGAYVLVFASVVAGTFRYVGTRKLKRRIQHLEILQHERARISQDMHDEVGATLTEIAILSELAKKKPQEAGNYVQQISDRAGQVIDGLGEIIWTMNPKNDSLDNLVGHIRREVTKNLGLANIRCTFVAPDCIPPDQISSEARRNIYLVVKEAVHNAVKHSGATQVSVTVGLVAHGLEIVVADNGRGFDLNGGDAAGNGLHNMNKRMIDIGGTFKIVSRPGEGTKVTLFT